MRAGFLASRLGPWLFLFAAVAAAAGQTASPAGAVPVARFTWSGDTTPPVKVRVLPQSARFGEAVAVVIEGEPGAQLPSASALSVDVDWLVPDPKAVLPPLGELPPGEGPRLVVPWRVYHLGPWRVAWGDAAAGETLAALGRLEAATTIMPVREPRAVGGLPRGFFWILALVGAAAAGRMLWRQRRGGGRAVPAGRPLPPPAWLLAAQQLWELERSPAGGRPDCRKFLDRLAAILRGYLQGRFFLPAAEMTAAEVAAAGRAAGWPAPQIGGFCELLADLDGLRYAPAAVTALHCRQHLSRALDLIEDVRILPVWSPVAPPALAAATAAWQQLRLRYERGPSGVERAAC